MEACGGHPPLAIVGGYPHPPSDLGYVYQDVSVIK